MQVIIGIIFIISFVILSIILHIKKKIAPTVTIALLLFSILGGFAIANIDIIERVKWKDVEVETYERQVADIKDRAINELKNEIAVQKESIENVIANAEKLKNQLYLVEYQGIGDYANYNIIGGLPGGAVEGVSMGPTSPIYGWSKGLMVRQGDKIICKCSPLAIEKCKQVIEQMPQYPFSYYWIGYMLKGKRR